MHAVGSSYASLTRKMLEEKFKDQCRVVIGDSVDAVSNALWNIEKVKDIRELSAIL